MSARLVAVSRTFFLLFGAAALWGLPGALTAQDARIRSAMSAAAAAIASDATIMDWDMTVLREGSAHWTCLPDMPDTATKDPMCLDEPWLEWLHAYMNQSTPDIDRVGFGYMLQPPGAGNSNLDPYHQGQTATNEWIETEPPHVMMVVPDEAMLEGLPTSPDQGGPWVMWRGTPLVHVMIPTVPQPAPGGVVVFSQNKCANENLPEIQRSMEEVFGPVLDRMVTEGALTGWGVLTHGWGDDWNWNIWYAAESHAAFVEGWDTYVSRLSEEHPGWFQSFVPLCTDHKDNIYTVGR